MQQTQPLSQQRMQDSDDDMRAFAVIVNDGDQVIQGQDQEVQRQDQSAWLNNEEYTEFEAGVNNMGKVK